MDLTQLQADLNALVVALEGAAEDAHDSAALEAVRVRFLSKKGELTALSKGLGKLPPEQRSGAGKAINAAKQRASAAISGRTAALKAAALSDRLGAERIDVTLPGLRALAGRPHPINQTMDDMRLVFQGLGFSFREYPELEDESHNFDALNTPDWHPARDMHDTFYLDEATLGWKGLMRTHTSAFQSRAMKLRGTPPMREITTGRCYRKDAIDATHSPIFHQLDGFAVSKDASFAELKWVLGRMAEGLFGAGTKTRFRPSFFPFTTPSAEVDVTCVMCAGEGCRVCSQTGWVEVLGAGMMRPEVLRAGGIDPDEYRGYAFGIGVDRISMLRWSIDDIRHFFDNDVAFLSQF